MTRPELRSLCGVIAALWPGQGWPDATVTVTAPLFAPVEHRHAEAALARLFREGREFPPSPSVLLKLADDLAEAERDRLVALPEAAPTPEQLAAAARGRALVRQALERLEADPGAIRRGKPAMSEEARQTQAERTAAAEPSLKPEYRRELERLISEGAEDRIPARWQRYVAEVKAAMGDAT